MIFYLGTHKSCWLARTDVPLFVSRRTLATVRTLPRALGLWALDSGGFTELSLHGKYTVDAMTYSSEVRRFSQEIGKLAFAAPQDWMCEPIMLARTGLSVKEHQRRTIHSYRLLRQLAPDLPWVPVLQGWTVADYLRHVEDYSRASIELAGLPLVGLGSVCRRQGTAEAEDLIRELSAHGIRLHLFGFKLSGLRKCARYAASSDSMAWSFDARRSAPLPGCEHAKCSNCMRYALRWREKVLRAVHGSQAAEQKMLTDLTEDTRHERSRVRAIGQGPPAPCRAGAESGPQGRLPGEGPG